MLQVGLKYGLADKTYTNKNVQRSISPLPCSSVLMHATRRSVFQVGCSECCEVQMYRLCYAVQLERVASSPFFRSEHPTGYARLKPPPRVGCEVPGRQDAMLSMRDLPAKRAAEMRSFLSRRFLCCEHLFVPRSAWRMQCDASRRI